MFGRRAWWATAILGVASQLLLSCSGRHEVDPSVQSRGIDAERALKAKSLASNVTSGVPVVELQASRRSLSVGGAPVRITALAASEQGLVMVDNQRDLVVRLGYDDLLGGHPQHLSQFDSLLRPWSVKAHSTGVSVYDNSGLWFLPTGSAKVARTRAFLTINDFLPLQGGGVVFQLINLHENSDVLELFSPELKRIASWSPAGDGAPRGMQAMAHLSHCGTDVLVAMQHRPWVYVLSSNLVEKRRLALDFPLLAEVASLGEAPALTRPMSGFTWEPSLIGGAVCVQERLFVLLDLPRPTILELTQSGSLIAEYRVAGTHRGSVEGLAYRDGDHAIDLLTIAKTGTMTQLLGVTISKPAR